MLVLSVWFLWLTAVKSIQLASVFNIFSCAVAVCSPMQILLKLNMRCRTLNGHNLFPKMGLMGNSPGVLYKECPFQRHQIRLVAYFFVRVQSKSGLADYWAQLSNSMCFSWSLPQLENWPPNSPDLSPVVYSWWGITTDGVSSQKFQTLISWNAC